ncbi:acyl-CoA dehydrogenase family protein [Ramlibacter sp.]|uniref:acyl-CoA dehydrogenase family protein n=1 Tax=Ramlibacter sp. TaxID=1917967 RepID=UPI002BDD4DC2|nr:acyl-CoA dehydrogenase family protein [Ramlibacter sp.]HWI80816.1 acyl-CoA dehydrogenase family protein [Ramlibacter sp.]
MTWTLDQERRMLRDSAQSFLTERAPVAHLRQLRDSADARGYSPELWTAFAAQGYSATLVPEDHGGLGLGLAEAGLIAEQIGHTLAPTPFLSTAVLAAWLLRRAGSAAQQAAWLARIAEADTVMALAVDERSRHRASAIETTAVRDGADWKIDGRKLLVVDGHVAQAFIVAARTAGGMALLLVPAGAPGLTVERTVLVDAHNAARLAFDGVRVDAQALVGGVDTGAALLAQVLDVGRAVVSAELLGIADEVFDRTVRYLKERRQFDRPIGEFQALQHRAAALFCDLELTRALVRQALQAIDQGASNAPLLVAQAKARAGLSADRAVQEGVQMHGGIGMTDELDIGLFMKRARVLQELFGDAAVQMDRAAALAGY